MPSRTRTSRTSHDASSFDLLDDDLDLEALSDDEIEQLLFEHEQEDSQSVFNLPTVAGLGLILVGTVYLLQEMGLWTGFDITAAAAMLPWAAGILIILLGFGVLSWRPRRKKKRKVKKGVEVPTGAETVVVEEEAKPKAKKRLAKSRHNRVIAGVCSGIAEYFNIDPTLVRIGFVVAAIFTDMAVVPAYIILAFAMPKQQPVTAEERIRIIRDS